MKSRNGITLIALIITIIVLLILAGISINLIAGDNGVLEKAKTSSLKTNKEKEKEEIKLVHSDGLISYKAGDSNFGEFVNYVEEKITQKDWVLSLNENYCYDDAVAFTIDSQLQRIYLTLYKDGGMSITELNSGGGMYSEPGIEESMIAPTDLFDYEVLSEGSGLTDSEGLPIDEVKIIGIKPEYANGHGYNVYTGRNELSGTNYGIIYKGERISDTLVVPYQVEIDGSLYKVTEVDLSVWGKLDYPWAGSRLVAVETIIYPNTVRTIYAGKNTYSGGPDIKELKRVVLPEGLKSIPAEMFLGCENLVSINLPVGLEEIGRRAFEDCRNIKHLTIPFACIYVGSGAFRNWSASQSIYCARSEPATSWESYWNYCSNATINWGVR